jgi:cellulose synthase/poly-beta-1,6-N-acetylglucosamine synthase-like glycosyltransferase
MIRFWILNFASAFLFSNNKKSSLFSRVIQSFFKSLNNILCNMLKLYWVIVKTLHL